MAISSWAVPAAARTLAGQGPRHEVAGVTYVVQEGDTLWDLATRVSPSEDPRLVVARIVEANEVDPGALVPGEQLVLPAA